MKHYPFLEGILEKLQAKGTLRQTTKLEEDTIFMYPDSFCYSFTWEEYRKVYAGKTLDSIDACVILDGLAEFETYHVVATGNIIPTNNNITWDGYLYLLDLNDSLWGNYGLYGRFNSSSVSTGYLRTTGKYFILM